MTNDASEPTRQPIDLPAGREVLERVARRFMERNSVPGMVIGVRHRGQEEILPLGVVDLETRWAVTPGTLFRCASVTKIFTAMTVMAMVDRGLLRLDTPVVEYLPWLTLGDAGTTATLTLRHCLTHTTGLWGHVEEDYGPGDDALASFVRTFGRLRVLAEPGRHWGYANAGFAIAGAVAEAVSDAPYEEAVRAAVLDPLALSGTTYSVDDVVALPHAIGHELPPGRPAPRRAADHHMVRNWNPSGGLWSTASDLLRVGRLLGGDGMLDGARVLSPASVAEMRRPQVDGPSWADAWGLGLDIRRIGDVDVLGHGGSFGGFKSRLTFVPAHDLGIVVLANAAEAGPAIEATVRHVLRSTLGLEGTEPSRVAVPEAALARCCGTYRAYGVEYLVRVADGALELVGGRPDRQSDPRPTVQRLIPIGGDRFLLDDPEQHRIVAFLGDGERPSLMRNGPLHVRDDA